MFEKLALAFVRVVVLALISFTGTTNVPVVTRTAISEADTTTINISAASLAHRIAFASDRAHPFYFDIYTMNADGTDIRRLTNNLSENKTPAWSPDEEQIAFTSDRDGALPLDTVDNSVIAFDSLQKVS